MYCLYEKGYNSHARDHKCFNLKKGKVFEIRDIILFTDFKYHKYRFK